MSGLRALPPTVIRRKHSLRQLQPAHAGLLAVERAARALYVELAGHLAELEAEQPELAAWLTTALWMLEIAAKELSTETDPAALRAGISAATLQVMRISCGIELAAAMGFLDREASRFDDHLSGILSRLERARQGE
jgi:hypothetical protein